MTNVEDELQSSPKRAGYREECRAFMPPSPSVHELAALEAALPPEQRLMAARRRAARLVLEEQLVLWLECLLAALERRSQ